MLLYTVRGLTIYLWESEFSNPGINLGDTNLSPFFRHFFWVWSTYLGINAFQAYNSTEESFCKYWGKAFFPLLLLNLLQYWFCFMFGLFFGLEACEILSLWPGIEPTPPALEVWNLNHWIKTFAHFWALVFLLLNCKCNLYILDTISLPQIRFSNILSHSVYFTFTVMFLYFKIFISISQIKLLNFLMYSDYSK